MLISFRRAVLAGACMAVCAAWAVEPPGGADAPLAIAMSHALLVRAAVSTAPRAATQATSTASTTSTSTSVASAPLSLAPASLLGQSVPANPFLAGTTLSLSEAYGLALQNDPTIRSVRHATDVRRERVPQARAQLLPNISASLSRYRNDLESTSPSIGGRTTSRLLYNSSANSITVRQPIYRPFQRADLRQARAEVRDAEALLQVEEQSLAVRTTQAYLEGLAAADRLTLVRARLRAYGIYLDAARRRFEGGAGTRTDVDEAQARIDLALAQELEAQQLVELTRRQLEAITGMPVASVVRIDASTLALRLPEPAELDAWLDRTEASSPELRALKARLDAAVQGVEKAKAGFRPTLDLVAQWSVSSSENVTQINSRYDQKLIGLQLNVPLFTGGYVSSQVRQATAEQVRASDLLESARRELRVRAHKEYRGVSEGIARARALEQAVRSASVLVDSARRSFEGGVRTLGDILGAEEQLAAAQRELDEARYLYLLSHVRLRALAGQADRAAMNQFNGWFGR